VGQATIACEIHSRIASPTSCPSFDNSQPVMAFLFSFYFLPFILSLFTIKQPGWGIFFAAIQDSELLA
jgi:hypothetical protein